MNHFQHEKALVHPRAVVGEGTRVWAFAHILEGAVVGKQCNICDGCFIEGGAVLGDRVTLKNGVAVFNGITLGNDVFVGAGTVFINDRYPRSNRADAWTLEKTLVKKGAALGANATIMCGITIGEYAVVGAGSVVTKNVPAHSIIVGNPAKAAGHACCCGRKLSSDLRCSCGLKYELSNSGLSRRL